MDAGKEILSSLNFLGYDTPSAERVSEIVRKYSFKNMSKREQGDENTSSFLRKGIAGDWKNKFSQEACSVFDKYGGEMLVKLQYERDQKWY